MYFQVTLDDGVPRLEVELTVLNQSVALHLLRLFVTGEGIADRRAGDDILQRGIELGRLRQRIHGIARIMRAHGAEFQDVAAA